MNHETVMSTFFVAVWHRKVMNKKAARHMQTVSLRKETSTPAWRPQLEECVHATASQD